ncbi:MAG: lysophospholipase L1-like esterase [Oceanicoccus sp.]|jgi:lysophospholipase L1-like esterase
MTTLKNWVNSAKTVAASFALLSLIACGSGSYVETADRSEIITLGDSIFDLSGDIQRILEDRAGQTFRDYTLSGAELSGGIVANSVERQYSDAKSTDANIETVVMDGGGNDILIPAIILDPYGCRTHWWRWSISRSCKNLINDQYVNLVNLLNKMDADGVDNIIYLGYYELPRGNKNLTSALNYGDEKLGQACNNTTGNCTFLDPRGMVPASDVLSDNIHPNANASRTLADLIWPVLQPLL